MNATNLNLIHKVYKEGESDFNSKLLILEKLLYLTIDYMEVGEATNSLEYGFSDLILEFLEKIHAKTLEVVDQDISDPDVQLIVNSVDFLWFPLTKKYIRDDYKIREVQIKIYNNLICVYRQAGYFNLALKVIFLAEKMQEEDDLSNEKLLKNRVSTLLNKSVILSELFSHDKAISEIKKAISLLEQLYKILNITKTDKFEDEMKEYNHLKMVSHFNLAVECEYLYKKEEAISFYTISKQLAIENKNEELKRKCINALKKLTK